ncbi:MAG: hypothetical protein HYV47_00140 [Candidatus Nealsonbacteria bacterium]|nr:hypothetical protein [Candidatus Nealsonbacteria bacterium]
MLEIILALLSFFSLLGIGFILFKKIPSLLELPGDDFPKWPIISILKKGVKSIPGSQKFDYELYLEKILSRVRVLTLKTESKTGNWLTWLRQRRNGHNGHSNGEYWDKLKKVKDGKQL